MAATRVDALRFTPLYIALILLLAMKSTNAFSTTYSAKGFSKNVTKLLDSLLSEYDRRIRPGHGGPPTNIMVNMNVRSMGPFSEKQESYAMQLYMRQVWYDPRLKFKKSDWGRSEFSMNWMFAARLWKPDTFFINGKNSYAHKITAPNMFIRLAHNGQITWSIRLTVRATCKMHLRKFPLDTQVCPLSLASYGYNANDMTYSWTDKLVTVAEDVSIAQYELINVTTSEAKVRVRRKEEISTLTVKFHLKRQQGFFLLQVYIPCILIVCCSWVAFWITKKDVPGRVALGVTTVLSMTTLGFGGRSAWPAVSYATALDYFVILCFAFVFAAVLEFAMINFVERAANKRRKKLDDLRQKLIERLTAGGEEGTMQVTTTLLEDKHHFVKDSLREMLKVPLSVVPADDLPLADEEEEEEGLPGDTKAGIKEVLKIPLTVVPESVEALGTRLLTHKEEAEVRSSSDVEVVSSADNSDSGGAVSDRERQSAETRQATPKGRSGSVAEEQPTVVQVEVTEDLPSPPPPVTVWQLLMKKRELIRQMSPDNTILPSEEDLLDRFSIFDLYARRVFPTLFFLLFTIYWVLFNYYITDEFPDEGKVPTDGLVVT